MASANTVDTMIAELEQRRSTIDDAIAALRKLDGAVPEAAIPDPARRSSPRRVNGGTRQVAPVAGDREARKAAARQAWEAGEPIKAVAKIGGCSEATIYGWSSTGKWKRPKAGAAQGDALPGKVRCPHCELWTEVDPCSNCGKKVRK